VGALFCVRGEPRPVHSGMIQTPLAEALAPVRQSPGEPPLPLGDRFMTGKARFIFPVLMAGIMAFLMTALVTWLNLGLPPDFVRHWLAAFAVAWPCAAATAFIAIPVARRATGLIVRIIGE
jgi:Protein of unknown function (DUF2798)